MHILLTRPIENINPTQQQLLALGHMVSCEPLLTVTTFNTSQPEGAFTGIILTSANGARALASNLHNLAQSLPVFTTGNGTQKAAEVAGFTNCTTISGSAKTLAQTLSSHLPNPTSQRLLYPCAKKTAQNMPQLLKKAGILCTQWPIYETSEAQVFSDKTANALQNKSIDAVFLYSLRTAKCFTRLISNEGFEWPNVFTLSAEIAQNLPPDIQTNCTFPNLPVEAELLSLL